MVCLGFWSAAIHRRFLTFVTFWSAAIYRRFLLFVSWNEAGEADSLLNPAFCFSLSIGSYRTAKAAWLLEGRRKESGDKSPHSKGPASNGNGRVAGRPAIEEKRR
jgi:hypothetical protein